jgi:glyoxylase-like metal-dependent hydrolase (beta-lactamase superfamily II)
MAGRGWVELADRVFVRRYAFYDQNIGAIVGDDGILVIDTRTSHVQGEEIRAHLRELTPLPVIGVVNTHGHSDHVFGNHVFRPVNIWGHVRCATMIETTGAAQRAALVKGMPAMAEEFGAVVLDPPDRTFDERARIDIGGRHVELRHLGRGHTDNDIVAIVEGAGVLFAGDLVENGAIPYFGDAFPIDWPATAEALLALVDGWVVPGHGDHANREFVAAQLEDFRAIADLGGRINAGELALDDAIAAAPYPADAAREPLERAVAQLRGELDGA